MDVFDRIDQKTLDRRDWQLSMLALVIILVLGAGMALLMYPAVFGSSAGAVPPSSRTLFFGFCALCILMVAYLLNRQYVVHQLRARLVEERKEIAQLREQASAELLGTLPGFSRFQDQLAMVFRRAAQIHEPLSLVLVRLKPSDLFAKGPEMQVAFGDAAKVLLRKLREEDSLYHFSSDVFAIVLPNASGSVANRMAERLAEGLTDASGASNRFSFEIQVVNYPEQATTASEMERMASSFRSQEVPMAESA
jgi:GGDEF domain-containing protein